MRCFTVLLACGWMLFKPPLGDPQKGVVFDDSRPLSEWSVAAGFDTAKDCNNEIEKGIQQARQLWSAQDGLIKEWRDTRQKPPFLEIFGYVLARCIPSDTIGFKFK